jgi:putative ABC transport system ATP-binding protein
VKAMDYVKIQLKNINLSLGEKKILQGINLNLEAKKIHVFWGKSGSGKTSLLNILNFLYTPNTGHILFDNQIVKFDNENLINRLRNQELAYFQQEMTFIEDLTVRENLLIFSQIKNVNLEEEILLSYAKKLNISQLLDENISVLSGGERQRAAFLKILVLPSQTILIDEPTNNLDKENISFILQAILMLKDQKKTIIIASHSEDVVNIADFVHRMEDINGKQSILPY